MTVADDHEASGGLGLTLTIAMHCEYHDGSPARSVSARRLNRIWESLMRSRMIVVSTLACILLLGTICPRLNYAQALSPLEPPGVHARIFDRLERRIAACDPATDVQRCVLDAIWKTADVTADGNVSSAEINRLFRIVAGGTAYQNYVASYREAETNRRSIPSLEPPENDELDAVVVAGSLGAIVTPGLVANFDYNSDGILSRTEVHGDTDFANLVSELEEQRKRLPHGVLEALRRLKRETLGTTSRDKQGGGATQRRGKKGTRTPRERLAEFCAEVPQSVLCRDL